MNKSTRRRSARLRNVNDEVERTGSGSDCDVSSEQNSKANRDESQSYRRRRLRSSSIGSESLPSSTSNKRTKRTNDSSSKLSISTDMSNRRQTRSLSRKVEIQTKSVTPSPGPSTQSKFIFSSSGRTLHRRNRRHDSNDDDGSVKELPYGVINLYRDQEFTMATSSATFQSPTKTRSKKRRATDGVRKQQQDRKSFEHGRRPTNLLMSDSFPSSSTSESLTIDYIHIYGDDYWQSLHDLERPVIDDPVMESYNETKGKQNSETLISGDIRTRRGRNYPLGSPSSRRSSSTSSSTTSLSTKVTPPESLSARLNDDDFKWTEPKRNPQPHQSPGNTKPMTIQPQLTPKMRSILVDWMIELSEHFNFGQSTLHLAVTMVDRVLASGQFMEEDTTGSSSGSSSNSGSRTSKSERSKASRSIRSSNHSDDSDADWDFDYGDDESEYDEDDDDDNKSKSTRCYLIPRDRFQLLGATCVWMACKIKETSPPKSSEIKYVSDHIYSKLQITRMERRVCNALNFSFFEAPTPHQFLFEYLRASLVGFGSEQKWSDKENDTRALPAAAMGVKLATHSVFRDMAQYLLELGRLPYRPTGRNPSLLTAAAVYLARVTLGIPAAMKNGAESAASKNMNLPLSSSSSVSDVDSSSDGFSYYWTPTLHHYTGYTHSDLRETVLEIHKYQMAAESSNLKAVFNKYKSKNYHRVALKTVVRVEDLGFS